MQSRKKNHSSQSLSLVNKPTSKWVVEVHKKNNGSSFVNYNQYINTYFCSKEDCPSDINPSFLMGVINGHFSKVTIDDTVQKGVIRCIGTMLQERNITEGQIVDFQLMDKTKDITPVATTMDLTLETLKYKNFVKKCSINYYKLCESVLKASEGIPLKVGDAIYIIVNDVKDYPGKTAYFRAQVNYLKNNPSTPYAIIKEDSNLMFSFSKNQKFQFEIEPSSLGLLHRLKIDWSLYGVGGLKQELNEIVQQVFLPRSMPIKRMQQYGIKFNRGVLLYGPPGTGKTLIARTIAKQFVSEKNLKIINGPELKSKYVGESERLLRGVFENAEQDWNKYGSKSPLHVIIIDEIDSLCPKRNSGNSTSSEIGNSLTTTLLTKLDGIDSPGNFVLFGLTNRKEQLDDALLRPGRLSVHLKIGLPNKEGRLAILNIYTKQMRENNLLDDSVDINRLADITSNWSGAELEHLVKTAAEKAISENFDTKNGLMSLKLMKSSKRVSKLHFDLALKSINPQHGRNRAKLDPILRQNFCVYNSTIKKYFDYLSLECSRIKSLNCSLLAITGDPGTGKTTLAAQLAMKSGAPYIELIQAEDLCFDPIKKKSEKIELVFEEAKKGECAAIILDGFDDIIQWDHGGGISSLTQYLRRQLHNLSLETHQIFVIVTCKEKSCIQEIFGKENTFYQCNLSSIASIKEIISLCENMGFTVKNLPQKDAVRPISIRQLLYNLKKYLTDIPDNEIDFSSFLSKINRFPDNKKNGFWLERSIQKNLDNMLIHSNGDNNIEKDKRLVSTPN